MGQRGAVLHARLRRWVGALVWFTLTGAAVAVARARRRAFFRGSFFCRVRTASTRSIRFHATALGRIGLLRDLFILGRAIAVGFRQGIFVLDFARVGLSGNRSASECQQSKH